VASRWPHRFPLVALPFDLGLRQVFAGAQVGIGAAGGCDCSYFGGWRDQPEVRFGQGLRPSAENYCSYNGPITHSRQAIRANETRSLRRTGPLSVGSPLGKKSP
jgi:hypothetical protein